MIDLNTSEWNVTAGSVLTPGLVDLQEFMFSGRYYLIASALARVCPSMTSLMLWITSLNRCRTSILLLVLNTFLKVRATYFKVDPTISGAFQCSACSVGSPPTCISSTINFLRIESPLSNEVCPSRVVWHNCCLAGCVGAFSKLLKCFSKLLSRLIALLQWGHFSFLMWGS